MKISSTNANKTYNWMKVTHVIKLLQKTPFQKPGQMY